MAAFAHQNTVLFQHCDPAGIVFYPRYFEMVNAVVETFFAKAVGWSFHQMHIVERVGVPMGRISADFHAPTQLGDVLDWTLAVTNVGGASANLDIRGACGEQARLSVKGTIVLVDLDRMKAQRWPDAIRAKLNAYSEAQQ